MATTTEDRLTFPPFPKPPPGVTITPFKKFRERGIVMFPTNSDDVERDGLGIPTIELRAKHDTDKCKSDTVRKKPPIPTPTEQPSKPGLKKWWDAWAENEDRRVGGPYDPNTSLLDRFYEVSTDFRRTRSWPQGPNGIAQYWDQFRLYVGLLSNTPIWTRTDKAQKPDSDSSDSETDDDEASFEKDSKAANTSIGVGQRTQPAPFRRLRPRPPYAYYGTDPVPVGSDNEVQALLENETARREEEMLNFLNDPETKLKIFFSSYMRKQGLIWSDKNLTSIPPLISFFLRFILRSRAFPETEIERGLHRALDVVVALAQKELPLTSAVAKQIPDGFHKACFALWGSKAPGFIEVEPIKDLEAKALARKEASLALERKEEPGTKEQKVGYGSGWGNASGGGWGNTDGGGWGSTSNGGWDSSTSTLSAEFAKNDPIQTKWPSLNKFEEELKNANVQIVHVDEAMMDEHDKLTAIRDNVNPAIDDLPDWARADNNWLSNGAGVESEADQWAGPMAVDWGPPEIHSLLTILGPTALPLTHAAGLVERSVRRIKSFSPPVSAPLKATPIASNSSPDSGETHGDPESVESALARRLASVVLAPWPGWDAHGDEMPHMVKPQLLDTSRSPGNDINGGPKLHDPLTDDITLLVEPELLNMLAPGMGLGGTWVQIARVQDLEGRKGKKKKKKGGKGKTVSEELRYWYIDELVLTLTSFHA